MKLNPNIEDRSFSNSYIRTLIQTFERWNTVWLGSRDNLWRQTLAVHAVNGKLKKLSNVSILWCMLHYWVEQCLARLQKQTTRLAHILLGYRHDFRSLQRACIRANLTRVHPLPLYSLILLSAENARMWISLMHRKWNGCGLIAGNRKPSGHCYWSGVQPLTAVTIPVNFKFTN